MIGRAESRKTDENPKQAFCEAGCFSAKQGRTETILSFEMIAKAWSRRFKRLTKLEAGEWAKAQTNALSKVRPANRMALKG